MWRKIMVNQANGDDDDREGIPSEGISVQLQFQIPRFHGAALNLMLLQQELCRAEPSASGISGMSDGRTERAQEKDRRRNCNG